uniref:Uncharacterized protein n=1 Tax=Arundo donax TaxID=35708 RepID=A0A0A9FY88_ARUDO
MRGHRYYEVQLDPDCVFTKLGGCCPFTLLSVPVQQRSYITKEPMILLLVKCELKVVSPTTYFLLAE